MAKGKEERPGCAVLLDERVRRAMETYRVFGYPGFVISEAKAYIDLLEEELGRRERGE